MAVITEWLAELAICGPRDIPKCIPGNSATKTGVEKVVP